MSIYKKNRAAFIQIAVSFCFIFILLIILTPLTYFKEFNFIPHRRSSDTASEQSGPLERFGEAYIISDIAGNEILTNIEINFFISRYFRDFRRYLNPVNYPFLLPSISFKILLLSILIFIIRSWQQIPVMAISIGGHAPPRRA